MTSNTKKPKPPQVTFEKRCVQSLNKKLNYMILLKLKERIEIATEMGESHFREFKSGFQGPFDNKTRRDVKSICHDISKTLVAFANADGGELILGVEDDGSITGLDYNDDKLKILLEAPKNYIHESTPLSPNKAQIVDYNGKKVAYFSVQQGTQFIYVTSGGKCLKRKDLDSMPVSPKAIQLERAEKQSREYDRAFVDGADINDLDKELLSKVAEEFSKTISVEKFLQHLDLAEFDGEKLKLRKASLLLFGKNPHKWHPRLQVRIMEVKGTKVKSGKDFNVIKDEEITENILKLIEGSWDCLRQYLTETKFSSDAIFKSQVVYPELACKEALINAIAHRDYSIEGRGIEILVFDDRLEIKSPGVLLSSVSISDIQNKTGIHQSRNTYIARVLREIGYMRELGEGFRRIYELMEINDLTPPTLYSGNYSFVVTLSQQFIYTQEEKIWLENFQDLNLTREERTVVRLGAKGELISPKVIWNSVGIVDTEDYRQLLESLKSKEILISEISKPKANNIAKKQKIKDKKSISRFKIVKPNEGHVSKDLKNNVKNRSIDKIDDSDYSKLFIENIPYYCNKGDIEKVFSKYGDISSIDIPKSNYSNKNKGFAFVEFEKENSVILALKDKFNIYIDKRKVIAKRHNINK